MIEDNKIFEVLILNITQLIESSIDLKNYTNKKIIFNYNKTIINLINSIIRQIDRNAYSNSIEFDEQNSLFIMNVWRKNFKKDYSITMKFCEENMEINIEYIKEEEKK